MSTQYNVRYFKSEYDKRLEAHNKKMQELKSLKIPKPLQANIHSDISSPKDIGELMSYSPVLRPNTSKLDSDKSSFTKSMKQRDLVLPPLKTPDTKS